LDGWLSLLVGYRVHIEMTRQVVEPLNVVLVARTTCRVLEPLLKVEGWDGLAIQRHLHMIDTRQGFCIQGYQVLDLVSTRELGIGIIGVEFLLTREFGQLLNEGRGVLGEHSRIETFRP
jgi:hypothetical protein